MTGSELSLLEGNKQRGFWPGEAERASLLQATEHSARARHPSPASFASSRPAITNRRLTPRLWIWSASLDLLGQIGEKSEKPFDIRRIGGSGDGARRYRERADGLVPGQRSTRDQRSRLATIAEGYSLTEKAVGGSEP